MTTLFDKLGGKAAVDLAVDKFYDIRIENISGNYLEIQEWSNNLKP